VITTSKAHIGTFPTTIEERDLYPYMGRETTCSLQDVWSRTFSMQEGIIRKGASQNQEYTGYQTRSTNEGGSNENRSG